MTEFDLIQRYFQRTTSQRADVCLGIGDDGAVLMPPLDSWLVATTDTLVEGVHFLPHTDPFDIGYKALAVNLSDLAAMGAEPRWILLALTLPQADEPWLTGFAAGLFSLAQAFQLQLVGGDITRGPLTITVQLIGSVEPHQQLTRAGAVVGDHIYVSGTLGDAGLGLALLTGQANSVAEEMTAYALQRLHRPSPRVALGIALRTLAHSAIDISDGLLADLQHLLASSHQLGARILVDQLPLSQALQATLPLPAARRLALGAGDDYELCFTIAPDKVAQLHDVCTPLAVQCSCIGHIEVVSGVRLVAADHDWSTAVVPGFMHFV